MKTFLAGNRHFTLLEIKQFADGSTNPYFDPLRGRESELLRFLADYAVSRRPSSDLSAQERRVGVGAVQS